MTEQRVSDELETVAVIEQWAAALKRIPEASRGSVLEWLRRLDMLHDVYSELVLEVQEIVETAAGGDKPGWLELLLRAIPLETGAGSWSELLESIEVGLADAREDARKAAEWAEQARAAAEAGQ